MAEVAAAFVWIIYNVQTLKYASEDGVIYGLLISLIFSAIFVGYSYGSGPVISYHYGAQTNIEGRNFPPSTFLLKGIRGGSLCRIQSKGSAHA